LKSLADASNRHQLFHAWNTGAEDCWRATSFLLVLEKRQGGTIIGQKVDEGVDAAKGGASDMKDKKMDENKKDSSKN
jgi:hypothetical protein